MGGLIILDSLKDFKSVADEIMEDITVSDKLKEKTLIKCRERTEKRFIKTALVPTVCFSIVLFLIITRVPSVNLNNSHENPVNNGNEGASIMLAPDSTMMQGADSGKEITPEGPVVSKNIQTFEEAKNYLNVDALEPSYLPNGFKLIEIYGVSNPDNGTRNLWIVYGAQDKSFTICVDGSSQWEIYDEYMEIEINKIRGYMRSYKDNFNENAELRWFVNENLYTVEGAISEEDAVRVARSLK
jgi:Domain of unknown function (DUF4367)